MDSPFNLWFWIPNASILVLFSALLLFIYFRNKALLKKYQPGTGKIISVTVETIPGFSKDINHSEILNNAEIRECKFYRILNVYDAGGLNISKYTRFEIEFWN